MFDFLTDLTEDKEEAGGMERMKGTSDHAQIGTARNDGSVLLRKAELEKGPEVDGDVVELSKFRNNRSIVSEDKAPDTIDISYGSAKNYSSFFTEAELEIFKNHESRFTEEELARSSRVHFKYFRIDRID